MLDEIEQRQGTTIKFSMEKKQKKKKTDQTKKLFTWMNADVDLFVRLFVSFSFLFASRVVIYTPKRRRQRLSAKPANANRKKRVS